MDCPPKYIDAEKLVRFAESMVLRKVGRDVSETLAIARFDPFQGYIEERDRTVNILCWHERLLQALLCPPSINTLSCFFV
jgi:hypothetical protein